MPTIIQEQAPQPADWAAGVAEELKLEWKEPTPFFFLPLQA